MKRGWRVVLLLVAAFLSAGAGAAWAGVDFHAAELFPLGGGGGGAATGDFNGDRRPDLAVVNTYSSDVSILLNRSTR